MEIIFNPKEALIFRAVQLGRAFPGWLLKLAKILLLVLTILTLFWWLATEKGAGFVLITLSLFVLLWLWHIFFNYKLKNPKLSVALEEAGAMNLAVFLDFNSAWAVKRAQSLARTMKFPQVNSLSLLAAILEDPRTNFIFKRASINKKALRKSLNEIAKSINGERKFRGGFSDNFLQAIQKAWEVGVSVSHGKITLGDLFWGLAQSQEVLKSVLFEMDLDDKDLKEIILWEERLTKEAERKRKWWRWERLGSVPGLAAGWAFAYTPTLDRFSRDLNVLTGRLGTSAHPKEVEAVERILARAGENNVILVGEPGVGKKTIVYKFAQKVREKETFPSLFYKRILELDIKSILAQARSQDETEILMERIFDEVMIAGNVILVISELHNVISPEKGPGRADLSGILRPYLESPKFQLIGITTYRGLHHHIEKRPAVSGLLKKVEVKPLSKDKTIRILEDFALNLEPKYSCFCPFRALREVVDLAEIYIQELPFPEKAVDLLEEAIVYAAKKEGSPVLLAEHIAEVISQKTEIPVGKVGEKEKEKLLNLENLLHQRIIDQEEAVKAVANAMRRERMGIRERKRPIGSFLFLGPTGVGKTQTAKTLAKVYFGSEERMIRLDMSEYQEINALRRFIGSQETGEEGQLTTAVREDPFSLILFDEMEKAHPRILDLLLQILDEGWLTDALGRRISFTHTIIIATSNAGAEFIREHIKEGSSFQILQKKLVDWLLTHHIFRPEFINRFDGVLIFKPLSYKHLVQIAELLLADLCERILKNKDVNLKFLPGVTEKIAELGYDPQFGARPMKRVIQKRVENLIAQKMLRGEIKRGDKLEISVEDLG